MEEPSKLILGGDIQQDRVNAARQNMPRPKKGRKKRELTIRQWDARHLPLEDGSIDKIATNLPFGKQVGSQERIGRLI